jgi:hypothetical protein
MKLSCQNLERQTRRLIIFVRKNKEISSHCNLGLVVITLVGEVHSKLQRYCEPLLSEFKLML